MTTEDISNQLLMTDLELAQHPFESLTTAERKRVYTDYASPHLGRRTHIIRELPVATLTPWECNRLLVHAHNAGKERREAYWAKVWNFFCEQHKHGKRVGFGKEYRL